MKHYIFEALQNRFIITETIMDNLTMIKLINQYNADGLLIYKNKPLEMIIYNKDGSKATMCGNGLRCFLLYGTMFHNLNKQKYKVKVLDKKINCEIINTNPFLSKIILKPNNKLPIQKKVFFYKGKMITLYSIFLGTLSYVIKKDNEIDNKSLIKFIKKELKLKDGNISFVEIINEEKLKVLTHERGVGFTKSCGTGNGASFYVTHELNLVKDNVTIINNGGTMNLRFIDNYVELIGSASLVGEINQ